MFIGRISSSDLSLGPQLEGEVEFALENLNMQITALNLLLINFLSLLICCLTVEYYS
jgi:hypothetical protein